MSCFASCLLNVTTSTVALSKAAFKSNGKDMLRQSNIEFTLGVTEREGLCSQSISSRSDTKRDIRLLASVYNT
jgi:hypothetical protein